MPDLESKKSDYRSSILCRAFVLGCIGSGSDVHSSRKNMEKGNASKISGRANLARFCGYIRFMRLLHRFENFCFQPIFCFQQNFEYECRWDFSRRNSVFSMNGRKFRTECRKMCDCGNGEHPCFFKGKRGVHRLVFTGIPWVH